MDEPQRTILSNVFVQSTLDGIEIKQYLSPDTSKTVLSLGSREFKELVSFSNVILSNLKKRPEKAKTLNEYETLFHYQTRFLLGKNIYVKISHVEEESHVQFTEYMMVNSMSVSGETVVCPGRFLLGLNRKQFEELISHKTLLKPKTTKNPYGQKRKAKRELNPASDSTKSTSTQTHRDIVHEDLFSLTRKKKVRFPKTSFEVSGETTQKMVEQKIPVLISNRETEI